MNARLPASSAPLRQGGRQLGLVTAATLYTLLTVFGAVVSAIGAANFGWQLGETVQVNKRMGQIRVEMKNVYDQLHRNGHITLAEAEIARHRIDRSAHLFDQLAERITARQGEIVLASGALFAGDIAGILIGGVKPGPFTHALEPRHAKHVEQVLTALHKANGAAVSAVSTEVGYLAARQVEINDIQDIVAELRAEWGEPTDAFEQAMLAAKFRIFLRGIEGLPREQKRAAYRQFWQRLKREGWKLKGLKTREARLDFFRKVKRDYAKRKARAPQLAVTRFSAQPKRVAPGDEVVLNADVRVTGARGTLTVAFEREGEQVFAAPAERVTLEPGESRSYARGYTLNVKEGTVAGNYKVAVKAELELEREAGRESIDVLHASKSDTFTVKPFTSCQRYRRKWEDRNHAVLERLQGPCESKRRSEVARLEALGMSRSDAESKAPPCGLAPKDGLYAGDLHIAHAFEDKRCNVHENYVGCMDPIANTFHRELMQCYRQYVASYSANNPERLQKTLSGCTGDATQKLSSGQERCERKACDAKCAAYGKVGRVGGIFMGACECVAP